MFVPLFAGDQEHTWNLDVRAVLYGFVMVYCFLGASIVSDFFMSAIEAITGKKRRVMQENGRMATFYVWNDTVANLTLLALGSSAPEILLSIVEVMKNEFYSGELGPSTIVGSAAFNTLIIIAVSIVAIPSPDNRYVKGNLVYNVTVVFSLFSYLWLLFICSICTKDFIDLWEAVVTFIFFFVLIIAAFFTHKYEEALEEKAELAAVMAQGEVRDTAGELQDRRQSVHKPKVRKLLNPHLAVIKHHQELMTDKTQNKILTRATMRGSVFAATPSDGSHAGGSMLNTVFGTAGLTESIASLVAKSPPAGDHGKGITAANGKRISNPAGILTFLVDNLEVKGGISDVTISVPVLRRNGANGMVSCKYHLEPFGAVPGYDYKDVKGTLVYPAGIVMQEVQLTVFPQRASEQSEAFQLILDSPEGGVLFNPNDDGKDDRGILTVTICNNMGPENEDEFPSLTSRCFDSLIDPELMQYGFDLWREQIVEALQPAPDSDEAATLAEQLMHFVSLPWKLIFAVLAPPSVFCGGWILFFVCLGLIGVLTALVADLAETFGCCLEIEMGVTAIIVVAPGTSLPDLFASQAAALADQHADASIVNVTGSNSVNVFLGIGLPWSLAAIIWRIRGATTEWKARYPEYVNSHPDGGFVVKAGSLGYSVIVFSCVAVICLGTLRIRRNLIGGELGGGYISKNGTGVFFLMLWVWYLAWNIAKSSSDAADVGQWISIGIAVMYCFFVAAVDIACQLGIIESKAPSRSAVEDPNDASDSNPVSDKADMQEVGLLEADARLGSLNSGDTSPSGEIVGKAADTLPAVSVELSSNRTSTSRLTESVKGSATSPGAKKKKKPPGPPAAKRSNSGEGNPNVVSNKLKQSKTKLSQA